MGKYKLNRKAAQDLYGIYEYGLERYGERQADNYYRAFFVRFEQIAQTPYRYPAADHIREGYRRTVCGRDTVYFRIAADGVEIMRVVGRQDF